jgi:hypothetical protein
MRYEKDSLKDYILYEMSNDSIMYMINQDNKFQLCYNKDIEKIRLYFKVIFYNRDLNNSLVTILNFINEKLKSDNYNWTIMSNERMIDKNHIVSLYFFSDKYSIELSKLKKLIDNFYLSEVIFDLSIYYTFNTKYREFITLPIPNQSNQYFKYNPIYKMFYGNPMNLVVTNVENLINFE